VALHQQHQLFLKIDLSTHQVIPLAKFNFLIGQFRFRDLLTNFVVVTEQVLESRICLGKRADDVRMLGKKGF
jgi:hypothetical protein